MPPTHPAKRPYAGTGAHNQTAITTYFHTSSITSSEHGADDSISRTHGYENPLSPPLPATVQANLLSVGMRVRKSVPEGYKTGAYSAFGLFSEDAAFPPHSKSSSSRAHSKGSHTRTRELTPFCGILKVGGLAQQAYSEGSSDDEDVPDVDDVPFLSSQASTISSASTVPPPTKKRRFSDEEEEVDKDDYNIVTVYQDDDVSPRSRPGNSTAHIFSSRTIVMPKPRRKNHDGGKALDSAATGQENVMDFDFEEADFLDYDALGIREVEMRDM